MSRRNDQFQAFLSPSFDPISLPPMPRLPETPTRFLADPIFVPKISLGRTPQKNSENCSATHELQKFWTFFWIRPAGATCDRRAVNARMGRLRLSEAPRVAERILGRVAESMLARAAAITQIEPPRDLRVENFVGY